MKKNIITGLIIVFLLYVAGQSIYLLIQERKDNNRLKRDIQISQQSLEDVVLKNGDLASKNYVLQYTLNEVKDGLAGRDILKELENLGIKPKYVTNYSETIIQNTKEIYVRVRDSIINDTVTAEVFSFNDEHYSVNGLKVGDQQHVSIAHRDSLIQVIYKGDRLTKSGKKAPKWWVFTPRALQQVIYCKDSTSHVSYAKTIQIIKK